VGAAVLPSLGTMQNDVNNLLKPMSSVHLINDISETLRLASKSWADQVAELPNSISDIANHSRSLRSRPVVCLRGSSTTTTVKAVSRRPTCFVSRLALDTTEEDLTAMLESKGIIDVNCKRIEAKNGRTFSTSAFRVSCSETSKNLFYDESSWPENDELRDWIFYNNLVNH